MRNRYPKIYIRSKNELAKHLSHKNFSRSESSDLINYVIKNFDKCWKDNKNKSEPLKDKYVRSAKGTKLGLLLDMINKKVLAPHDKLLPNFIFGGVSDKNHIQASLYLLGSKRRRVILKMDIKRFFEKISYERVYSFFRYKCQCDDRASKILADLCCVPLGPKGSNSAIKTLGRGFATSSRLAVWCNLDIFLNLNWYINKKLKGKDPRIAIYVDDIGITASGVTKEEMKLLSLEVKNILENSDRNQSLPINDNKTEVISHEEGIEHLGLVLHRNKLALGVKTLAKRSRLKDKLRNSTDKKEKDLLREKLNANTNYKKYVESV